MKKTETIIIGLKKYAKAFWDSIPKKSNLFGFGYRSFADLILLASLKFISGGKPASPGFRQYIFHFGKRLTFKPSKISDGLLSDFFPNKSSKLTNL